MNPSATLLLLFIGCNERTEELDGLGAASSLENVQRRTLIHHLAGQCKAKDGAACNTLGDLYATPGWGGGKMVTVARNLYSRACGLGHPEGCFQVSAWSQACDLGHPKSCELVDCLSE